MALSFRKVTAQKHVKHKIGKNVFEVYYQVLFGYENGTKPVYLVDFKVLLNGQLVIASLKNARKAWVVPEGVQPESDLAFFMMMDTLTSDLLIALWAEDEKAKGAKGLKRYEALMAYHAVAHEWWDFLCTKHQNLEQILHKVFEKAHERFEE